MDTQTAFENFLDKVVNLNKGRVDRIEEAQRVLSEFVKNQEDFKDLYIDAIPQGSYRQKTIIKPIGDDGAFDVDLLIKLKENLDWSPADYHAKLAAAFKESGRYEDLTDTNGKTRCVTIDYEGDFHVDLVPAVERDGKYYVCNKTTDEFEETDGDGYSQWFEQQDANAGGHLVPVVRLLKYLRDSKGNFDTKSIILTTIAGMQVNPGDSFASTPEALSAILGRMNDYLSRFESAPSILNPAMPGETFDRHWKNDGKGFNDLKAAVGAYADMSSDAISTTDTDEAIERWQELFGDKFAASEEKVMSTAIGVAAPTIISNPAKPWASSELLCHLTDLPKKS